ncbi:NAD-dependent deacylase [Rhodococcus sp. HNM0569]|uniref:SIR2 family NAD-dependent protein deacylase n=1 Tax=Rhodococcus sp. HNM0569 TaxID=2716340 RepID=UPI00146A2293|nr:NAD-dependent deacylase [Rhodococcus sp. HNM0569]NLU84417.1 NAD-dependent deacylase [Rhodococcus sp. HNM0569]
MNTDSVGDVADVCRSAGSVAILTGAGMSAESGIPTFRDAQTGLWAQFDAAALATPEAWQRDPATVWAWYQWRAALVRKSEPNAGHRAIARWQQLTPHVSVVTQNVDDLHERAGSLVTAHVHGSLFQPRCSRCSTVFDDECVLPTEPVASLEPPRCARCGGAVRPGVVWFGEELPRTEWNAADAAATTADVVLVIGTSGVVYPFAALPEAARDAGAVVVEVNPERTPIGSVAHHVVRATAATAVPAIVERLGLGT